MAGDPYWNNVVLAMHMDVGANADANYSSVVLGLHMDGTSGSTTFTDVTGITVTPNGNAQISTAQSKFGGSSGLFDGTGDYLSTPSTTNFEFGTGDFTVECWVYFNTTGVAADLVSKRASGSAAGGPWVLYRTGGNLFAFACSSNNTSLEINLTGTTTTAINTWYHIAAVRTGGNVKLYVNGVQEATAAYASSIYVDSSAVSVGGALDGTRSLNGYLDDVRVSKGFARYTAAFAVPTTPFHPNSISGFTDRKGHTITAAGNAQISTAQSKFGGASAAFDGTGDYVSTPTSADFNFGSGDWTVEMFARFNAVNTNQGVFALGTSGGVPLLIYLASTAELRLYMSSTGTWDVASALPIKTGVAANTWYHIAVARSGNNVYCFVDGTKTNQIMTTQALAAALADITIGAWASAANVLNGYIDDLRITKGVARYTANFTAPTSAFPDLPMLISGTVKDATATLAPRAVRVHRKSDGALAGAMTSHATTGAFSVPALDASTHYAVVHDTDADPHWASVILATHFDTDSVIDPYQVNNVLGLHMDGLNASTIFRDTTGKTITAVGNAQISTAISRFGGASAFLDGAGDYLSVPNSTDLNLTNVHTIEAWVWLTALPVSTAMATIAARWDGTGNNRSWMFGIFNNAGTYTLRAYYSADGVAATAYDSTSFTPTTGAWYHLAVSTDGTNLRFFLNGALLGAAQANAITPYASSIVATVGAFSVPTAANWFLTGYIDDLRITKAVARYTAAFTAPTVPFGSFKDLTDKDILVGGVPSISATTKKYGSAALSCTGSVAWLEVADAAIFRLAALPCTVEFWFYLNALPAAGTQMNFVQKGYAGNSTVEWQIILGNTGGVYSLIVSNSADGATLINTSAVYTPALSTWIHVAYCRDTSTARLYVDGVLLAVSPPTTNFQGGGAVTIGANAVGANALNGHMDDLRITRGVARYCANFTPPERAFVGAIGAGTNNAVIYDDIVPV